MTKTFMRFLMFLSCILALSFLILIFISQFKIAPLFVLQFIYDRHPEDVLSLKLSIGLIGLAFALLAAYLKFKLDIKPATSAPKIS